MKSVIIYSGGMDSFTLLNELHSQGHELHALTLLYGQRHAKETICARKVCESLGIPHKVIDLGIINQLLKGSALTSPGVAMPHGHYEEETMRTTVVPNRNMIFLSLAVGWAISLRARTVYYAAHGGDHAIYPDCRKGFVEALQRAVLRGNYEEVLLDTPYLKLTKTEILAKGLQAGLNYASTWTCYEGAALPCHRCGACVERAEAFEANGVEDPLLRSG